jgi:hypothetical protein
MRLKSFFCGDSSSSVDGFREDLNGKNPAFRPVNCRVAAFLKAGYSVKQNARTGLRFSTKFTYLGY